MGSHTEQRVDLSDLGSSPPIKVSEPWSVTKALDAIPENHMPPRQISPFLSFCHILERLKTTKREGWRRFGIENGESISDHMYRMSILSMLAPKSLARQLDMAKCVKMCLIHDMAELLVGDITPVDGVLKAEKSRREADTMDHLTLGLLGDLNGGITGQEMRNIWKEYEDSETLESRFVHDVDKVELLLQMVEYERRSEGTVNLGEFSRVSNELRLPESREWAEQILRERKKLWTSKDSFEEEKSQHGASNGQP